MRENNLPISHPTYGGTLTYLIDLEVGTHFYVENGAWKGRIGYEDQKKTVYIVGIDETKFISEDCYAWITVLK